MGAPAGHLPYPGGGKPRLWDKAEDIQNAFDSYFGAVKEKNDGREKGEEQVPLGIFALSHHCNMSYDAFLDYESGDMDTETEKYGQVCKKAREKVAAFAESQIYKHTAGATLHLVNMTRKMRDPWKNAMHQELTGPNNSPLQITITPTQAAIT